MKSSHSSPWTLALAASNPQDLEDLARLAAWRLDQGLDPLVSQSSGGGPWRAAVVGADRTELVEALLALASGSEHPCVTRGEAQAGLKVGFLLTGEGNARAGAGAGLVASNAAFAAAAHDALAAVGREDLCRLDADLSRHQDPVEGKLLLSALQAGLAAALAEVGVQPSVVLGHSHGEYTAAVLSGALGAADGMRLVADIGGRMAGLPEDGAMAQAQLGVEALEALLAGLDDVVISGDNAPDRATLSGSVAGVEAAIVRLEAAGARARRLPLGRAYHSPWVAPVVEGHLAAARAVTTVPPVFSWVSSVTGGLLSVLTPEHWAAHALGRVRFREAFAVARDLADVWVELGPGPALVRLTSRERPGLAALDGDLDESVAFARLLGWLWCRGCPVEAPALSTDTVSPDKAPSTTEIAAARTWAEGRRATAHSLSLDAARALVRAALGALLGRPVGPELDGVGLVDLGLDSLGSVALSGELAARSGRRVGATAALERGTIEGLARLLAGETRIEARRRPIAAAGPVAVVGVGLRLPGGVRDLEDLWALLARGGDTSGAVPDGRWPEGAAGAASHRGSFLENIEGFDAGFFGISPREATALDPVHRLLLECAWEAIEDAGLLPSSLKGSATGAFIGVGPSEYAAAPAYQSPDALDAYSGLGTEPSVASGRISYVLGLRGPTLSLDTACSSSLVALHLAARALQRGECDLAFAGGGSLILSASMHAWLGSTGALSPDGRCKAFGETADGYGRGEGAGLLLLERLDDALAAGRRVLGVIRGSAINHDGAAAGRIHSPPASPHRAAAV